MPPLVHEVILLGMDSKMKSGMHIVFLKDELRLEGNDAKVGLIVRHERWLGFGWVRLVEIFSICCFKKSK